MGAFHENISVPAAEEGRMSEKELPSDQNLSLRYYVAECMEFVIMRSAAMGIYHSQVRKDAWEKRDAICARICLKPLILQTF